MPVIENRRVRTLLIDIETSPNLAHVWSLWQQNVGLSQLLSSTEMLCFAFKWLSEKGIEFYSVPKHGRDLMVRAAHAALDNADVVMHYNGRRFDIPHLNREFLQAGLTPPSPYKQIDLLATVKRQFRFPSNKLQYVSGALGLEGKAGHAGHELWVKCMAGDVSAWRAMEKYNRQDVALLESVYRKLQPWIVSHPSHGAMSGEDVCPSCGGKSLTRQGHAYTSQNSYQRFRCADCGRWSRSTRRHSGTQIREIT